MAINFDPQFTEEQNRAYALMLLREGFEQLIPKHREKALSLVEWHDDKGFLSDKQWEYVLNLATHVKPDKLSLNFATDKDVKPALQAIVEKADALIQAEHDAGKAHMAHFLTGLDKAKQFAAAYGASAAKMKTNPVLLGNLKAAAVKALKDPMGASWIDQEIAAITAAAAPKKKALSWAKALAKTPPGEKVAGLDPVEDYAWKTLGEATGLDLASLSPFKDSLLQSTAGMTKGLTIAEAKTLLLHVADEDSVVSAMAKVGIKDAGGINSVLVKAGFDPKLPPNDTFSHAVDKGDLVQYFGASHMFAIAKGDLKALGKDSGAFIVTEVDWDPSYKAGVMTLAEADKQAMEHYPPHGVSPWQAKQALLMMASPEPVLQQIGFNLQDKLGGFKPLVAAAKLDTPSPTFFKATKAVYHLDNAGTIDYVAGNHGFSVPITDLKSKHWGKTAGGQLPYSENTLHKGMVEPSAEFPHEPLEYSMHEAKNVLKLLAAPNPDNVAWAYGCLNKAGGINAMLAAAGIKDGFPVHKLLRVKKDLGEHTLILATYSHTVLITMDYLHDIKPVPVPDMKPNKPVFFTGKPKLEAKKAWDKHTGQLVTVLDLDALKVKNLWGNTDAFEVHVETGTNPASAMSVLFEKLFKKWDVVSQVVGPHKITVTFPMGSITDDNMVELKAMIQVAEGYANAPLDKIMDDWKTLDAKPQVHVNPTSGTLTAKCSMKSPPLTLKPQASKTVIVQTSKPKGLVLPKKKSVN